MGRFELIHSPYWSYSECADAFGCDLDDYLYYGGYPGAASLKDDEGRWLNYVRNSIIESSIANDVLQLADKGNAATIAHYVSLLSRAGLMSGLQKYDPKLIREKASSPRLVVHNTALMVAEYGRRRKALLTDPSLRGHLVESAVGAYLINRASIEGFSVFWWRDGNDEVDYVIAGKDAVTAIEVKSGRVKSTNGMTRFLVENPHAHPIIIGSTGCGIEEFLRGEIELFG